MVRLSKTADAKSEVKTNPDAQKLLVFAGLLAGFLALGGAFWLDKWGHPAPVATNAPAPPEATNTATVRLSAAEQFRTEADTSGFACYTCHDAKKQLLVKTNANGSILLSEPHKDIVMKHGQNNRNEHCFICHDPKNLELLRVSDGHTFKLTEGNLLCASCHGPSYRDWEAGVHGRTSGFWDRSKGPSVRADCTSCHDPHSPAFPAMKAAPRPNRMHPVPDTSDKAKGTH